LDLGGGRKGEFGNGWSCDFETLLDRAEGIGSQEDGKEAKGEMAADISKAKLIRSPLCHLSSAIFQSLLSKTQLTIPSAAVANVGITLYSRGVPQPCARIYRLPSSPKVAELETDPYSCDQTATTTTSTPQHQPDSTVESSASKMSPTNLRAQWLALAPSKSKANEMKSKPAKKLNCAAKLPPSATQADSRRALAEELLQSTPLPYPAEKVESSYPQVPGEEDLIGFVTTGNFNLAEGRGTAVGSVLVTKVLERIRDGELHASDKECKMCIIRNAGETVGRLGVWEVI